MDLLRVGREAVQRLLKAAGDGPKSLLVDASSMLRVSSVLSQTQLEEQAHVLLTESLDVLSNEETAQSQRDERLHYLDAVVLLEPCTESIAKLGVVLRQQRYVRMHVGFMRHTTGTLLQSLRELDLYHAVVHVLELQWDFDVYAPKLFVAPTASIDSVLLALAHQPSCVRFLSSSQPCSTLAYRLASNFAAKPSADIAQNRRCIVLLLDRHIDVITPLLTSWTYGAMLYQHLNVHMPGQSCRVGEQEFSLQVAHDALLHRWLHLDYMSLGQACADEVRRLAQIVRDSRPTTTHLDNEQVSRAPLVQQQMTRVTKHQQLLDELRRQIESRSLMRLSQLEQEMAVGGAAQHDDLNARLMRMLVDESIFFSDKQRLVVIYALRFAKSHGTALTLICHQLQAHASNHGLDGQYVEKLLRYFLTQQASAAMSISANNTMTKAAANLAAAVRNVAEVARAALDITADPLYAPRIGAIVMRALNNALDPRVFGTAAIDKNSGASTSSPQPQHVLVFIHGGITHAEAAHVNRLVAARKDSAHISVVMGGTELITSTSFLANASASM